MVEKGIKVLELKSSDNEYLHKDFHGALCYAIKYLDDKFGCRTTADYLQQVGIEVFSPLIAEIKKEGLTAIERHFKKIFEIEAGQAEFELQNNQLKITVLKCPAVSHLLATKQLFTERYCQTTVHINNAICQAAGFECSCDYKPSEGRCVQKFWRKGTK